MRIGIVCHNYSPHIGGVEIVARQLAYRFARQHEVVVVSTAWEQSSGISEEEGVTVYRLPALHATESAGVPYPLPFGPFVVQAFNALRSCDVLHAHGSLYVTTLMAQLASRRGLPLVVTEHVGFVRYSSPAINMIEHAAWNLIGDRVVRRSAGVTACNPKVRDWLTARLQRTVRFIPNGVDSETFRPRSQGERIAARLSLGLPQDEVIGLFVGRDVQKKNLQAVEAMAVSGFRLVMCGAVRTQIAPGVIDLGVVRHGQMADVFAASDFMIHAATGEGFPLAVQEAMACGLPVALLWDAGYAGIVDRDAVVAANSIGELSSAVALLAVDSATRAAVSVRARAFALRSWSWDAAVAQYLALFQSCVEDSGTGTKPTSRSSES